MSDISQLAGRVGGGERGSGAISSPSHIITLPGSERGGREGGYKNVPSSNLSKVSSICKYSFTMLILHADPKKKNTAEWYV
jgi:hypothetical protein